MRASVAFLNVVFGASCMLAGCADDGAPPRRAKQDTEAGDTEAGDTESDTTGPPPCDASPEALAGCVESARYDEDLRFIADIRNPGSTHWQAVQDLCFDRLTELGYEVEQHEYITGINIIGRRTGLANPEQEVLITAHYDHLPNCTGADDNASGVAGALEAARVMALGEYDRTITVACWDQEEAGKVGSRAFATEAIERGDQFVVNFNFEMIGYRTDEPNTQTVPGGFDQIFVDAYAQVEGNQFRGDFIALVSDDLARSSTDAMIAHAETLGLPTVLIELTQAYKSSALFADMQRSDHASFWDFDVPAMMITDTANFRNPNYHCTEGEDSVDRLDSEFSGQVVSITVAAAAQAAGMR